MLLLLYLSSRDMLIKLEPTINDNPYVLFIFHRRYNVFMIQGFQFVLWIWSIAIVYYHMFALVWMKFQKPF